MLMTVMALSCCVVWQIKLEEYGESYYNSRIPATIEQLKV